MAVWIVGGLVRSYRTMSGSTSMAAALAPGELGRVTMMFVLLVFAVFLSIWVIRLCVFAAEDEIR